MTKLEQLRDVILPLISKKQRGDESIIHDIVIGRFCPVDQNPCLMGTLEKCLKCWNREVSA